MYLIFTGSHLWDIKRPNHGATIMFRVKKGDRPSNPGTIDAQYWSLIEQCWAPSPSSRPKISDVLLRLRNITPVPR
ncbi:hypothetical protein BDR04DRAFT_339003 [Suillus decipiens]|nr:hypothetical protein BDR04DRAFT_339003 [Suillus decipiens]